MRRPFTRDQGTLCRGLCRQQCGSLAASCPRRCIASEQRNSPLRLHEDVLLRNELAAYIACEFAWKDEAGTAKLEYFTVLRKGRVTQH